MASSEDFTWGLASAPVSNASGNGTTDTPGLFHDIELNVDFVKLLMALAMAVLWISYLTFYHSRLLGFIASRFASHLVSDGHLSFGSFSFSFLSGKAMVRDFLWANRDFSIRIQDGWVVFRFWKSFIPKQRGEDFSHSPPRVLIQFNGVEIHVYNRSRKYQQLCQLFGQDLFEFSNDSHTTGMESSQAGTTWIWKDLLSSVKTTIASGRVIFGNHLVSSSLVISFDNLDCLYTIKPPTSLMDEALLSLKGNCENFRMSLVKSPNFSGPYEPPPRIMGEGFVIVQTSQLDFYYFRDECGVVPPQSTQSFTENCPCHGIDFKVNGSKIL